jgi:DNA-binding NtrC family response regulator
MKEKILIVEDEYVVADHLKRFLEKAGHRVCGIASSYSEAMSFIKVDKPTWVLLDICLNGKSSGIELAEQLSNFNIPFLFLSANMNQKTLEDVKKTKPYGFLSKPFKDKELMIMLDIAMDRHKKIMETKQVGLVDNDQNNMESSLNQFASALHSHINFDMMCLIATKDTKLLQHDIYIHRSENDEYSLWSCSELAGQLGISEHEYVNMRKAFNREHEPSYTVDIAFKRARMDWPLLKHISSAFDIESQLSFPFATKEGLPGISLFSRNNKAYCSGDISVLEGLQDMIKNTLKDIFREEQPSSLQQGKTNVKVVERSSHDKYEKAFEGIIGSSPALLEVLEQLKIVSPTSTSVLIMGESGTGKEKIAQAVHQLSPRHLKPFVVVNCAALPIALIESELFGHEKGAFTGAGDRRIGKFEQADGGTIFLDEIGELPMESQVKLLRVLQEKEIERVGGNQRKKVDVRVIAATNRNMEKEVAEGRFRLDLYYRLNVFPLELPGLKDRRMDIPELVQYFIDKYSTLMNKYVVSVSSVVMNQLVGYSWPGNIRELGHVIERSVLLAKSEVITEVSLPKNRGGEQEENKHYIKSFDENERDHILAVLKKCFGRVAGEGGAAELLRVPPTTLTSKIKRLGILRKHISPTE